MRKACQEDRKYFAGKPRAKCLFRWQQRGVLEAYSHTDSGGDKATRRSVSAGVIMRGGHCLTRYGPRTANGVAVLRRERAVRRSQNCIRRAWDPERRNGLRDIVWTGPRRSVDRWYRDGHCARPLRLPVIPSGHIAVSSFVCALGDLRLICVTASLAQERQLSKFHPSSLEFTSRHVTSRHSTGLDVT